MYAEGHPGVKMEEVERLSGVEEVGRKLGLVNVCREINTAHVTLRAAGAEGKGEKAKSREAEVDATAEK